jgi:hypothetical protein
MQSKSPEATPQIVEDPNFAAQQAQAQRSLIANLQTQAQMDTANIMTRYGNAQALASAGMGTPAPPLAEAVSSLGSKVML